MSASKAIDYVVRVINLSIAGPNTSRTERILVDRLRRQGIVVVAAMGNEDEEGNPTYYPAAYDIVVAVGAVAEDRRRAPYSQHRSPYRPCRAGVQCALDPANTWFRLSARDVLRGMGRNLDGDPACHRRNRARRRQVPAG